MHSLLKPDPMCLAMRLINWAVMTVFAVYAQIMLVKRKAAEEVVKKERDKAQKYLDVSAVIMLVIERDETISLMNRTGCAILGFAEAEIVGKNWFDTFLPEKEREPFKRHFEGCMRQPELLLEYSEGRVVTQMRGERIIAWHNSLLAGADGNVTALLSSGVDITELKKSEQEREKLIRELQAALSEVKILGSLLPICSSCKKIRDDTGYWHQVEEYIGSQTGTKFTHGICPECREQYYSQLSTWTSQEKDARTD
jgi:PAS domain S-box-containing protein